jgi:hypothetical protein
MKTPEVLRVYVGSFWDHPLMYRENKELFEMEEKDLMKDLKDLPRYFSPSLRPAPLPFYSLFFFPLFQPYISHPFQVRC